MAHLFVTPLHVFIVKWRAAVSLGDLGASVARWTQKIPTVQILMSLSYQAYTYTYIRAMLNDCWTADPC
jgi:hypothetical protein